MDAGFRREGACFGANAAAESPNCPTRKVWYLHKGSGDRLDQAEALSGTRIARDDCKLKLPDDRQSTDSGDGKDGTRVDQTDQGEESIGFVS